MDKILRQEKPAVNMWKFRNGSGVAFRSSYSLFCYGGKWNLNNFESAIAQATGTLADILITTKQTHQY